MKAMHLFFSHLLTDHQVNEAVTIHGVTTFSYLPEKLQQVWSNIPTNQIIPVEIIDLFLNYLNQNTIIDDIILVQGDFGLTFMIVDWCLNNNRVPVYATTERKAIEELFSDGTIKKTQIFLHKNFRKYKRI